MTIVKDEHGTVIFDDRDRKPFDSISPGRPAKHGWRNPPEFRGALPYRHSLPSLGEYGYPHRNAVLAFFRERATDALLDSDRYYDDWAARHGYVPCTAETRLEWHRVGRDPFTEDVEPGSATKVADVGPDFCGDVDGRDTCRWHGTK